MSASGMLYGPPVPASGAAAESLASAGHRAAMSFPVGKPISLAEASADVQQAVRAAQEQAKAAMVAETQLASMAKAKAKVKAAAAAAAVTSPAITGLTGLATTDGVTAAATTAAAAANRRAAAMAAAAGSPTLASIQGMPAPMVSSSFARQQQQLLQLQLQQQQQQQQQSTVFASILARQSHAAKLAELAAVEYERAALDLEQATAAQQRQAQAVMAMSQVGGASPYEVAMVQAQMLGEQMRLQGQMMPGASATVAATRAGGMMIPSMVALRAQQVQMQQQQQQSREAQAMQAPGQTKVSVAAPAQTPAPAPAPTAQRQPQTSSVAANGVKQAKPSATAPETSTVDTKTNKGEAPSKSAMEDELDAAEAVLSLMRGGVRRPSLAHQHTAKATATAATTSNAVSERQDKSHPAVKGQESSKPTAAASTLFAPSAQMLLQAATLESTSTETAEGKTEGKRKRASRRSSTDSKSSEASGDECGQGKKQKRTRSKKKPGQPRRPLSAYNIFFSEERARIIKSMDEEMDGDEDDGGVEEGQDIALMRDASANGPLKKRRMSLESTEGTPLASACSSPALSVDEVGAVAGQKAQQMLLDRRINPAGPDRSKRLHRRTHGRISFQDLARQIGQRWKTLPADRMDEYKRLAEIDMKRYKEDMVVWNAQQQQEQQQQQQEQE